MSMEAHAIADEKPFAGADEEYAALKARLEGKSAWDLEHSELEELIEEEGREILRRLMQGHLRLRAQQEEKENKLEAVVGSDGAARTHRRTETERKVMTLFGPVTQQRISYEGRGLESLQPMDAALNLPAEWQSHGLQRRVVQEVVRGSFDHAVEALIRSTGASVAKRQVEEVAIRAAADFERYDQKLWMQEMRKAAYPSAY